MQLTIPEELVLSKIYEIRGKKVMLDKDLAELYGVKTKRLKEQVRRNLERFPQHYMFELTENEFNLLRSQIATSKTERGGTRYLPMVFTEHGILQLSNAIKSRVAIQMSIRIIDVFVKMREMFLTHKDLLLQMEEIQSKVSGHDEKIELVFTYLRQFIEERKGPRKKMGFKLPEKN